MPCHCFGSTQKIVIFNNFFDLFLRERLYLTTASQTYRVTDNVGEVDWRHGVRVGGMRHALSDCEVADDQQCYDDDQQNVR